MKPELLKILRAVRRTILPMRGGGDSFPAKDAPWLEATANRSGPNTGEFADPQAPVAWQHETKGKDEVPADSTKSRKPPLMAETEDAAYLPSSSCGPQLQMASDENAGPQYPVGASPPPRCFEQLKQAGGTVLPAPHNLGHLSHVYKVVRPELARMLREEFAVHDNGTVQVNRYQWEGCGMRSPPAPPSDREELRAEFAIHPGGKDVNQDAVGFCQGILRDDSRREPFAVIAVADGVTRSLYSEFGALLAVGAALKSSVCFLESSCLTLGLPLTKPAVHQFARCLCRDMSHCSNTMRTLQEEIEAALSQFSEGDDGVAPSRAARGEARVHLSMLREEGRSHLSTTVIAVCATPRWFAAAGFGNGIVWVGFASGDTAAVWIPDSQMPLDCHVGTHHTPLKPSYAWSAALEPSGMVAVGAGTDGIPTMNALRDALQESGPEAVTKDVLDRIVNRQLEKCSSDSVDNAALARLDICAVCEEN